VTCKVTKKAREKPKVGGNALHLAVEIKLISYVEWVTFCLQIKTGRFETRLNPSTRFSKGMRDKIF